jgi:hypothetical protein
MRYRENAAARAASVVIPTDGGNKDRLEQLYGQIASAVFHVAQRPPCRIVRSARFFQEQSMAGAFPQLWCMPQKTAENLRLNANTSAEILNVGVVVELERHVMYTALLAFKGGDGSQAATELKDEAEKEGYLDSMMGGVPSGTERKDGKRAQSETQATPPAKLPAVATVTKPGAAPTAAADAAKAAAVPAAKTAEAAAAAAQTAEAAAKKRAEEEAD